MSHSDLLKTLEDLQEHKRLIEALQAEADALADAVKAHMGDETLLLCGPYRVTYGPVTTSRIDAKAIKADHPDIAAAYTVTTTTRRFCVK